MKMCRSLHKLENLFKIIRQSKNPKISIEKNIKTKNCKGTQKTF